MIAVLYLGERLAGLPFLPFDFFDWIARILPGQVITFGIDTMVSIISLIPFGATSDLAKASEQIMAISNVIGLGLVFGLALAYLSRILRKDLPSFGIVGGIVYFVLALYVDYAVGFSNAALLPKLLWLGVVLIGWGYLMGLAVYHAGPSMANEPEARLSRRAFLTVGGVGVLAVALGSWGLARLFGEEDTATANTGAGTQPPEELASADGTSGPAASPSEEELAARPEPVPGTRDELTPNDQFYRIDINTRAPSVPGDDWRLRIFGMVDNEMELSVDDLRAMPSQTQVVTMQCISNRIGGDLTGTSRWTGVRFKDVLAAAGLQASATQIVLRSTDDFFESVSMEDAMDDRTLLVYDMNGVPLPEEHGYPLRIYIPNRYGMKQPKWIETMEVVDKDVQGYWVIRGWDMEARPHTVSVVDSVQVDSVEADAETNSVSVGGMAWAGARGISKVEVQVDDADWNEAELITPPLSPLSWVLWRYEWPYEEGRHEFRVRAYDGDGQLQELDEAPPRPDGATGIHSLAISI